MNFRIQYFSFDKIESVCFIKIKPFMLNFTTLFILMMELKSFEFESMWIHILVYLLI